MTRQTLWFFLCKSLLTQSPSSKCTKAWVSWQRCTETDHIKMLWFTCSYNEWFYHSDDTLRKATNRYCQVRQNMWQRCMLSLCKHDFHVLQLTTSATITNLHKDTCWWFFFLSFFPFFFFLILSIVFKWYKEFQFGKEISESKNPFGSENQIVLKVISELHYSNSRS